MSSIPSPSEGFAAFGLPDPVSRALEEAGYAEPTSIQSAMIPLGMDGHDIIGQAQTGTGKTAAFALPILAQLELNAKYPQALILAPTRELAMQVAKAFQTYGRFVKGLGVVAVYGGADMRTQLGQIKRGAQVIVGTPGRVMDHIRRGSLDLSRLRTLVLDEADEMLRMGFIDDVEWILEKTPEGRQIALFSATMPTAIRRIAERYLDDPREVVIEKKEAIVETIRQRVCRVPASQKFEALVRILEVEAVEKALIFARTRAGTAELAEKLNARGYRCTPLNGDIAQSQRERTVEAFRKGKGRRIIVATDVAARGLHVDGISHVFNYDPAGDVETYIHRIGRTGRAGNAGEAILLVGPRDHRTVASIQRESKTRLEEMTVPTAREINKARVSRFKDRIKERLAIGELDIFEELVGELEKESEITPAQVAAALAALLQGDDPLFVTDLPKGRKPSRLDAQRETGRQGQGPSQGPRSEGRRTPEAGMQTYRLEMGATDGIKHGNIVGAIANDIGIGGGSIGKIVVGARFSTVDLPKDTPAAMIKALAKLQIFGKNCAVSEFKGGDLQAAPTPERGRHRPAVRPNSRPGSRPGLNKKHPKAHRKGRTERQAP